jgi:nicotinamidase-related amidase
MLVSFGDYFEATAAVKGSDESEYSMKALIVVDVQNDFCPGGALACAMATMSCVYQRLGSRALPSLWRRRIGHPANHKSTALQSRE